MAGWQGFSPLEPVCPECGARLAEWGDPLPLDWRDDAERRRGANAHAIQAHRHFEHRVIPHVGDVIRYAEPWRGYVLVSDPWRVDAILPDYEGRGVDRLCLTNPRKSDDRCWPDVGDPRRPITIEIVTPAPTPAPTLLDLLADWTP